MKWGNKFTWCPWVLLPLWKQQSLCHGEAAASLSFPGANTAFSTRKPLSEDNDCRAKWLRWWKSHKEIQWPVPYSQGKPGLGNETPNLRCLIHLAAGAGCSGVPQTLRGLCCQAGLSFQSLWKARFPKEQPLAGANRAECAVAIAGEGIYGNPWKGITPGSLQTAGPQTVPGHLQGMLWSQDNFNPFSKVLPVLISEQVKGK